MFKLFAAGYLACAVGALLVAHYRNDITPHTLQWHLITGAAVFGWSMLLVAAYRGLKRLQGRG